MRWLLLIVFLLPVVTAQYELCAGCSYGSKCIPVGSQVNSGSGVMYCGDDSAINPAKPDSASCSQNYECNSFMCAGSVCQTLNPETKIFNSHSRMFFPLMGVGVLIILAIVFLMAKSMIKPKAVKGAEVKSKNGAKNQPSALPSSIRLMPMNKKYAQFDKLERQIEASTKKIGRK
jgi:hypothetical protein